MVVGVVLDVDVPVAVPLPVEVPLVLIVEDDEMESVPLCVLEKLAPRVVDDDGVVIILIVLVTVAIAMGESEPLLDEVGVGREVGIALCVADALPSIEIVDRGVEELLNVIEGLSVDEGVGEGDGDCEGV